MHVTIYSKPGCGACVTTKKQFDREEVTYTAIDIQAPETPPSVRDSLIARGATSLPVVVITDNAGQELDWWSGLKPEKITETINAVKA